ncbi:MAG: putative Ig domain-containing protein [Protaetiibacter sp.]
MHRRAARATPAHADSAPSERRAPRRRTRVIATVTAAAMIALALGATPLAATALPAGYVGTGDSDSVFDGYAGNRVLPLMTAGEEYSGTLTGPQYGSETDWCWSVTSGSLPAGIEMAVDGECAPSATFAGTPLAGEFAFELQLADTAHESTLTLVFSGVVESGKLPTTTTISAPAVAAFHSIVLSATVAGDPATGAPSGTVQFLVPGPRVVGTGTLTDGVATATITLDKTNAGALVGFTAVYLGDDAYEGSSSTAGKVRIYVPTAAGNVQWNGLPVEGAVVELRAGTDADAVIDTDTTTDEGGFELDPGAITTTGDVEKTYIIRATFGDGTVLFHKFGAHDVTDVAAAERTTPLTWKNYILIEHRTAPVWTDAELAAPRLGSVYADSVAAASHNAVYYLLDDGDLPTGLTLDDETGALVGTPSCSTPMPFSLVSTTTCTYDFTIRATNGFGSVSQRFTGSLLPAGVGPSWDDDVLGVFQVGVAVADSVHAVGDPDISYAVTSGALPAGLTLVSDGTISGTPTTTGPYSFTITAANDFGTITADFTGDVIAAPALDLTLQFRPGTLLSDATTTISADGLLVGSTYTLTMYSSPRVLHTGIVGATGGFSLPVSLPADTPAGAHRLVLTGTAADGTAMQDEAWFSLLGDGRIGAISYTGPVGGLAATGADPFASSTLGLLLLLLGGGMLVAATRRVRA